MFAVLRVFTRRRPPSDLLSGSVLGREVGRDELRGLGLGWSALCGGDVRLRGVSSSAARCAKARGDCKKAEMSEKKLTRHFVDHRRVKLVAGSGGKGSCSFHSEPRKEWGGPDGGNGGDGGSVIIKADRLVKSLAQVVPVYKGENGQSGSSKNCYGRNGNPTYISVPLGTVVKEQGKTIVDLEKHGHEYVAVFGGAGGKGNRFFLSNENRAPMTSTPGGAGEERLLQLELRTMAHAGLVGFPNAGKSSLLRTISNARPAVAAYPFTTLNPHVGIVTYRDHEQVAVADIPGIIRGAHLNRGLGISFLRHIERCRFLLFVLDLSAPEPLTQLQDLRFELDQYEPGLSQRPQAIVANKMDLPKAQEKLECLKSQVTQRVIPVSALTGQNTEELILHLRELYDGYLQGECTKATRVYKGCNHRLNSIMGNFGSSICSGNNNIPVSIHAITAAVKIDLSGNDAEVIENLQQARDGQRTFIKLYRNDKVELFAPIVSSFS